MRIILCTVLSRLVSTSVKVGLDAIFNACYNGVCLQMYFFDPSLHFKITSIELVVVAILCTYACVCYVTLNVDVRMRVLYCSRCRRPHSRQQCPAREEQATSVAREDTSRLCATLMSDETAFMGAVQDSVHTNPWVVGKSLKFRTDTGADMSAVPQKVFKSMPGASRKPAKKILSGRYCL